jgi:DNA-directed RNA polymerase specialized sigma24 family protein
MSVNKKIAPKIMKIISNHWDINDITQDTYFKVLSYAYGIEDTIIESKKKKDGLPRD